MKRIFLTIILVFMLSLLAIGPVSAQKGTANIKGEVIEKSPTTLTILTNKGESFIVTVPEGFNTRTIQVHASVLVKAIPKDGGGWLAQSIKQVGNSFGNDEENEIEDDDQAEGHKDNSAYCQDGKQEKPHPLAAKIAERYGVKQDTVMGYFCDGFGMGAIMLALKTSQIKGFDTSVVALLDARASGIGWGNIWKDLKLIGSEKNGQSPPGLLKKKDKKNK